jgi:hypothetical protein
VIKVLVSAIAVSSVLGTVGSVSVAGQKQEGPFIACFHQKQRKYTPRVKPRQCDIAGIRKGRGMTFVNVPVRAIRWNHWGASQSLGSFGIDKRDGRGVRVVAYRAVRCEGGYRLYTKVTVVYPGPGFGFILNLPGCEGFQSWIVRRFSIR